MCSISIQSESQALKCASSFAVSRRTSRLTSSRMASFDTASRSTRAFSVSKPSKRREREPEPGRALRSGRLWLGSASPCSAASLVSLPPSPERCCRRSNDFCVGLPDVAGVGLPPSPGQPPNRRSVDPLRNRRRRRRHRAHPVLRDRTRPSNSRNRRPRYVRLIHHKRQVQAGISGRA